MQIKKRNEGREENYDEKRQTGNPRHMSVLRHKDVQNRKELNQNPEEYAVTFFLSALPAIYLQVKGIRASGSHTL